MNIEGTIERIIHILELFHHIYNRKDEYLNFNSNIRLSGSLYISS